MKTNLLLNQPNNTLNCRQNSITCQTAFNGTNPLLNNKQKIDEFELEKNLDTKEGQIAFLQYHLDKAKGSQGFIARGFNKLKGWTGLGLSSKKLDAELAAFMNDQVPFEKVCQDINKFKYNQKEATDILVDTVGAAVSFTLSHAGTNFGNAASCLFKTKKLSGAMPILTGTIFGSSFKSITKWIDSFGIEKSQRKENRHFFRDMLTGGIAGASGALPGVVGTQPIPMIGSFMGGMALNSGVRYLALDKEDKSFGDFCRQKLENPGVKLFATAALGTLAACNYKNLSEWDKVKQKCQGEIKDAKPFTAENLETNFEALAGKKGLDVFNTSKENSLGYILNQCKTNNNDAITTLTTIEQTNMLFPKYLQTLPNNFADTPQGADICKTFPILPKVIELVKSECTGARNQKAAQKHIDELFGENTYTIIKPKDKDGKEIEAKPLGVGSVAETWLVKDKADKEYVVKMVKPRISKETIEKQKATMLEMLSTENPVEKETQTKALEQLYETWEKELDLKAESEAATLLSKNVKEAKVVKPIETSKDGSAYVMEKAPGQLFGDFLTFNSLQQDLGMIDFKTNHIFVNSAITGYINLFLEQIFGVPKKGDKVIHADPHPGNIFVNMKKDGKAEFTFIDTGNVIRMSTKESVQNMIHHLNYFIGNTEAIAANLLKNAKYPDCMDETKAHSELKKYLDNEFYNGKTALSGPQDFMQIFNIVDNLALKWMQDNRVIADPTQANAHKANYTYISNLLALFLSDPLHKAYQLLSVDNKEETTHRKTLIEASAITDETKKQLLPIFNENFDKLFKNIKNIEKLVNEVSDLEGKKSEILFKFYKKALKAVKAISICDETKGSTLLSKLNEKVNSIFEKINAYNASIKEEKMKKYAEASYNYNYTMFTQLNKKQHNELKFVTSASTKEDIDNNQYLLSYVSNKLKFSQSNLTEEEKTQNTTNKKNMEETYKPIDEAHKEKFQKQAEEVLAETASKSIFSSMQEVLGPMLKNLFSCGFEHPFQSMAEVKQVKKYIDENKEKAMNTLKLMTFNGKQVNEGGTSKFIELF